MATFTPGADRLFWSPIADNPTKHPISDIITLEEKAECDLYRVAKLVLHEFDPISKELQPSEKLKSAKLGA